MPKTKHCRINLSRANLGEANLSEADVKGARMKKALLEGAYLREGVLSNATDNQLAECKSLHLATMPDGSKHN